MNIPEWIKPGLWGAVVGGILVSVLGFGWGGWVTGGTAAAMAQTSARDERLATLVPLCVEMARLDPERGTKLETIRAASTYQRRDAVMAAGWATIPGGAAPDRDMAQACLSKLEI